MRNNINNLKNYSEVNLLFHLIKYNYRRSDFLINNLLSNAVFGEKCFNKYLYCSRIYSIQQTYRGSSVLEALNVVRDNETQLNEKHEPCGAKHSTNQILLKYKGREIVSKSFENLPTVLSHREYYLGKYFSFSYWSCCYRDIGEEKMKFFDVILIFDEQSQKGPELERYFNIVMFTKTNRHLFYNKKKSIIVGKHQLNYGAIFLLFYILLYIYDLIESKVKIIYSGSGINVEEMFVRRWSEELNNAQTWGKKK